MPCLNCAEYSAFADDGQLAGMSKTHLHVHVQSPVSSKQLYLQNQSTAGWLTFLKYGGGVIDIVGKGRSIYTAKALFRVTQLA